MLHNPVPHFLDNRRQGPGFVPAEVDCTEELLFIFIDGNGDNPFRLHGRDFRKNGHAKLQGLHTAGPCCIPGLQNHIGNHGSLDKSLIKLGPETACLVEKDHRFFGKISKGHGIFWQEDVPDRL